MLEMTPEQAKAGLQAAEQARNRLITSPPTPRWYHVVLGMAVLYAGVVAALDFPSAVAWTVWLLALAVLLVFRGGAAVSPRMASLIGEPVKLRLRALPWRSRVVLLGTIFTFSFAAPFVGGAIRDTGVSHPHVIAAAVLTPVLVGLVVAQARLTRRRGRREA